ncbi:MAG: cation-translocating P-type ATPase [Acidimicrobiia bacterium]
MTTQESSAAVKAWHALPVPDIEADLDSDLQSGLRAEEAARRLSNVGPNVLQTLGGPSRLQLFFGQFADALIWVLLVAAFISGVILNDWVDAIVILAIVFMNATIGYTQESRAEAALTALKEMTAPDARVVRDGSERRIPAADLVPGDVVVLEVGDLVPADGRLVRAAHLKVDESLLTGESLPVEKETQAVSEDASLADRTSMVYSGTAVASGRGRVLVTATGQTTAMGQIAELLSEDEPPTPLQVSLDRVGRRIGLLALGSAALIFVLGILQGFDVPLMFLTAVALAVAAIPEGLPAVVTITLARGVQRMAREHAIVRRLPAVESLGSASVICTDQTGTLTQNKIRVHEIAFTDARRTPSETDASDERVKRFAQVAALCNDGVLGPDGPLGDPTETALLLALSEGMGIDPGRLRDDHPRLDEVAFDSRRKRMSTFHPWGEGYLLATKGAPEVVLERATMVASESGIEPIDEERRAAAAAIATSMAGRGLRTLALAYRDLSERPSNVEAAETDLVIVAIVGMSDAVRAEAGPAVAMAHESGIRVVMVTGDHPVTAQAIGRQLGILSETGRVMPGDRLRETSEEELIAQVQDNEVYARVDPVDKVKIVHAWQARGEIVAMTGDGVNDAPALRAADIGIAMGSGTAVTQEASAIVLTDDNFATIVSAVREGRAIFANLKKVVYFLLSCNASEVIVMLFGFLLFGSLGEPLLPTQLLWINLITDGLPAIALGLDPPVPGIMSLSPDRGREMLAPRRLLRILAQGSILALATLAVALYGVYLKEADWEYVRTLMFTTLVAVQLLHAFNVRAEGPGVRAVGFGGNPTLLIAVLAPVVLQLGVVYTPIGNRLFSTVPIDAIEWLVIAGFTFASFLVVAAAERLVERRRSAAAAKA